MPSSYVVTEPAPATNNYMRCGRGGAGNIVRKPSPALTNALTTEATSTTINNSPSSSRRQRFFSGRGGVGNAHDASQRLAPSLDDEITLAAARDSAPVGHCGIGGAGNVFRRKGSDASSDVGSDASSARSASSSTAKLWARVSSNFVRE